MTEETDLVLSTPYIRSTWYDIYDIRMKYIYMMFYVCLMVFASSTRTYSAVYFPRVVLFFVGLKLLL